MEEVEEANRTAVECCHRFLNQLSQPQEKVQYVNIVAETGEAVSKFKRVVSLLSNGLINRRVRKQKIIQAPIYQKIFLESPVAAYRAESSSKSSQPLPRILLESAAPEPDTSAKSLPQISHKFLESLALEMDSFSSQALQHSSQITSSTPFQFLHQMQNNQRFQLQQQMKFHAGMYRSNSSINLKFDSSSCTPTVSSTRSFISSLSMDGSVAKLDGKAFQLIGVPQSSDCVSIQQPLKRRCSGRGEDGNGKCSTSGKCHCSKRRKLRVKRSIKVPAISKKLADIPPDEYSWRKYGQKPIKGSPHPRLLAERQQASLHTIVTGCHCLLGLRGRSSVWNVILPLFSSPSWQVGICFLWLDVAADLRTEIRDREDKLGMNPSAYLPNET